ncbi:monocarboxylate transporter 12 [Trichonephila clavipes]|nr:monocarboxylate transporter 12 [Trichonephila clavipes]
MTVNNEMRKNNAPLKISSSGFLCPGQQQINNFNADEVWKQSIRDQNSQTPVPLDGSRRSSLRRDRRDYSRPLYRKDVFYSGSIRNLPEYKQSQGDVRSYVASVTSIPRDIPMSHSVLNRLDNRSVVFESRPPQEFCPCIHLPKSMTDTIYEMLDFSLLKNNVFLLICISNIVGMIGFYVPYVYITDSSIMKGVPADQSAFLLSVIGITNTVGRLLFGWIADRPGVSALLVNNVSIVLTGICVFCLPFCTTYTSIVIDCVLFGLFVWCVCGRLVVKVTDTCLACHEFEPSAAEDSSCRGACCSLNLAALIGEVWKLGEGKGQLRCRPRLLTMVKKYEVRLQ